MIPQPTKAFMALAVANSIQVFKGEDPVTCSIFQFTGTKFLRGSIEQSILHHKSKTQTLPIRGRQKFPQLTKPLVIEISSDVYGSEK